VIKIFEDLLWKGKRLIFTWHFYQEWELLGKPLATVLDILNNGRHERISKRQQKYQCIHPWRGGELCLVYVEEDDYILIHVKPRKRR